MSMNSLLVMLLAGSAGVLLGLVFFGGLWWTLRRAFASKRPALWVGGSLVLRMGAASAGFVFVSAGDWRRLLSCLLGFWAARWLVLRLTPGRPARTSVSTAVRGTGEATAEPS